MSLEINVVTPKGPIDRIKHHELAFTDLSKNVLHKTTIHKHIELLRINLEQLLKSHKELAESLRLERAKLVYYNVLLNGKPIISEPKDNRYHGSQKRRNDARTHGGRLIGPVTVFKQSKVIDKWICGSCNDIAFEKKSALSILEKRVKSDLLRFPAQHLALNMMGDQIYADTVSYELAVIYQLIVENVFEKKGRSKIPVFATSLKEKYSTLWSTEAYHAAYLLNFGRLYELLFDSNGDFKGKSKTATQHLPRRPTGSTRSGTRRRAFRDKELRRISSMAPLLPSIFARVPVMMMWDDHDVIDDWNIDASWASKARNEKQVKTALAPLAAFQAPYLMKGEISTLKVNRVSSSVQIEPRFNRTFAKSAEVNDHLVLTMENGELIASAIETKRVESGLARQESAIDKALQKKTASNNSPATLFFNTQLISPRSVLYGQQLRSNQYWNRLVDKEALDSYPSVLLTILDALPSKIQLVSGDVHYGYQREFQYCENGQEKHFKQISASAISNEPGFLLKKLLDYDLRHYSDAYSTLYLKSGASTTGLLLVHMEGPELFRFAANIGGMLGWLQVQAARSIRELEFSMELDGRKPDQVKLSKLTKLRQAVSALTENYAFHRVLHTKRLKKPYIVTPNFVVIEKNVARHVTSSLTIS
ncbi:hypothetical protein N9850_04175 [Granulosicoccus sp.]|nr:hypothetical protein [Granulosicoccus sp.]MDB4222946.1 hypothetical protein [Granulosicoccus sp.]